MTASCDESDVIIIGGGPAGAVAALVAARAGLRVRVIERTTFPRFHIGESFLPECTELLRRLGLLDRLRSLDHMVKLGAEFGFGDTADDRTQRFHFRDTLTDGPRETFNIARAEFDRMLLDAAREAGATVMEGVKAERIDRLEENDVAVRAGGRTHRSRWLIDASGQATVVGRHLKTRRVIETLRNVAYFQHYENVQRLDGDEAGYPTLVMCREGWMWLIPLDEYRTSVGVVMDREAAKGVGVPADRMLGWAVERCPLVQRRMAGASGPAWNHIVADFSYRCEPFAGPGYFLAGDAATFLDPIFSTGVTLGMKGASRAAENIAAVEAGHLSHAAARRDYIRYVRSSSALLFRLVHRFYGHAFRELLMEGRGPLGVHKAVISLIAGHVFPRPSRSVAWRFRLLESLAALQERGLLVERTPPFSLLENHG